MKNVNKHFLATLGLGLLATAAHAQQGIGTGGTAPRTMLDVNGAISVTETTAAVSGNAASVPTGFSLVRLTGTATAPVALTAATTPAPVAGQLLTIYNPTAQTATFAGQPIPTGQTLGFVYSNGAWQATAGGGNGITASNGLIKTGSDVQLGGALTRATSVSGISSTNTLTFTGTEAATFLSTTPASTAGTQALVLSVPSSGSVVGSGPYLTFENGFGLEIGRVANIAEAGLRFGLGFTTYSGGTAERMRINAAGNLGLGTTIPQARVDIVADNTNDNVLMRSYGGNTLPAYVIQKYRGSVAAPADIQTGDGMGGMYMTGQVGGLIPGYLSSMTGTYRGNTARPNLSDLRFTTSNALRMVIDTSGYVGIGTGSPHATLDINGSLAPNYRGVSAAAYTLLPTDYAVVYSGSGAGTFTLPTGVGVRGRIFSIKNTTVAQTLTLVVPTGEGIDGSTTLTVGPDQSVELITTGATAAGVRTYEILSTNSAGSTPPLAASNGLTLNGNTVELGGALTKATLVSGIDAPNTLTFSGLSAPTVLSTAPINATGTQSLVLSAPSAGANIGSGPYLSFLNGFSTEIGRVSNVAEGSFHFGLGFGTYSGGTGNPGLTERMRLAYNGYLGLGTSTPQARVDIVADNASGFNADNVLLRSYGTNTNPAYVISKYRGSVAAPADLQTGDAIGGMYMTGQVGGAVAPYLSTMSGAYRGTTARPNLSDLRFSTSSAQRMVIDTSGYVGINTGSPNATLDINGSLAPNYRFVTAASATVLPTDYTVIYNGTGAGTLTLPTGVGVRGRVFIIKNTSAAQTLTLAAPAGEGIDNSATLTIGPDQSVQVVTTGVTTAGIRSYELLGFNSASPAQPLTNANNGLSLDGNTVQLGGALTEPTTISGINNTNSLTLGNSATAAAAGQRTLDLTGNYSGTVPGSGVSIDFAGGTYGRIRSYTEGSGNVGLNFSTSGASNVLHLGAAGFVGLGTAAPVYKFHVVSDAATGGVDDDYTFQTYGATADPTFSLQRLRGTVAAPANMQNGDVMGKFGFGGRAGGSIINSLSALSANYLGDGTTPLSDLRIITSNTERMRIDQVGNVGIGTAAPIARLQSVTTGGTGLLDDDYYFDTYTGATGSSGLGFYYRHARGTVSAPANLANGDLLSITDNRGYINGAFIPSAFQNSFYVGNGTTNLSYTAFGTSGAERLRIDQNGSVGIGTTAPDATLEVAGPMLLTFQTANRVSNGVTVRKRGAAGNANAAVLAGSELGYYSYLGWDGTAYGRGSYNYVETTENWTPSAHGASYLIYTTPNGSTTNTERLRVEQNGNVGIGTTAPNSLLSVTSNLVGPKITLYDAGSTTAHYGFGVSSSQLNYDAGGNHVFYIGGKNGTGAEIFRVASGGVTIRSGSSAPALNISTTAAALGIVPANTAGNIYYEAGGNENHIFGGSVLTDVNNLRTLGLANGRWATIYGVNGDYSGTLAVAGATTLGANGTTLNAVIRAANVAPAAAIAVATSGTATATANFTVTNAAVAGSIVNVSPTAALPAGVSIAYARVSAASTVTIGFVNASATAQTIPTSTTFNIVVTQ